MEKIIEGYNGRYTIDQNGNVFSNGKKMSPYKINSGYLCIKLRNHGKVKAYLIHRMYPQYSRSAIDQVVDYKTYRCV